MGGARGFPGPTLTAPRHPRWGALEPAGGASITTQKNLFARGKALGVRLAVFCLLSLLAMILDHQHRLEPARTVLGLVVYPLQMAVHAPLEAGHLVYENLRFRSSLISENRDLHHQLLMTQARLGRYQELEAENRRLRRLLDSSLKAGEQVLIAEVLAVEMDPFSRQILLNKGSRSRVYGGQPLVDAHGVMGQVTHVTPLSATALLITDPSHALPVQVNRNGLRSVAVGTGAANTLELLYLPNNADVLVGDLVVTSGLGGRFPSGYPVGTVAGVDTDTGRPFAQVTVTPSAQLERNREVLLVWPAQVPLALEGERPGNEEFP